MPQDPTADQIATTAGTEHESQDGAIPPPGAKDFSGEIKVASRIVDYLSSGLYESPGACLKELVNNSYDADARLVEVFVKPDAEQIIVADDGVGLTRDEFERHFQRVSESHKRDERDTTEELHRPKIGRIGIGMIAANELCEQMEIYSTVKGDNRLLRVQIDFQAMRGELAERRDEADEAVIKKADYSGWEELSAERSAHYTRIFLKRVRGDARDILSGAREDTQTAGRSSLYGCDPAGMVEALGDDAVRSWTDFDEYSQAMLEVGLNVPVRYAEGWAPSRIRRRLEDFEEAVDALEFTVHYDGTDLRKPIVLGRNEHENLVRRFEFEGENVGAKGYFFAQRTTIHPEDMNGVLIRIRNAAVGDYDRGWLGFRSSQNPLIQRWVSSELWANDQLEEALNIDRRTLRVTHPAYAELQQAFHTAYASVLAEARQKLYQKRSEQRRVKDARSEFSRVAEVAHEAGVSLPAEVRRAFKEAEDSEPDRAAVRRALARRSVSEIYGLVLEVARTELSPSAYRRFAASLVERLLR